MHDNDAQPPPAPTRHGQSEPAWLPIGGAISNSQPARQFFLESSCPAVAPAPLLSALRGNSESTARQVSARRPAQICSLRCLSDAGPVSPLRQALGACARRGVPSPLLHRRQPLPPRSRRLCPSTAKPGGQEEKEAGAHQAPRHHRTTLRRTQPAHVAKPPVRSEGSSPPPPTPVLFASQVTPLLFLQR